MVLGVNEQVSEPPTSAVQLVDTALPPSIPETLSVPVGAAPLPEATTVAVTVSCVPTNGAEPRLTLVAVAYAAETAVVGDVEGP